MSIKTIASKFLDLLAGSGLENREKIKEISKDHTTNFAVTFDFRPKLSLRTTNGNFFHHCANSHNGQGYKIKAIAEGLFELAKDAKTTQPSLKP